MSTETPEYAWIPDGSPERDWESAIEESAQDTGTAAFPSEKTAPLTMADISRVDVYAISYHHEGRWKPGDESGTELRLYAVLELVDGRWASLEAWNDYTGWGCQDGSAARIGVDRESVVRFGLTDEGRQALGLAEPGERTAVRPPTPENVAEMLTEGDNDYHDGNNWKPSISRRGNVVHIKITPYSEPDEDDLDDEAVELDDVHYRAVVVPGTDTPIVLSSQAQDVYVTTDLTGALWLACAAPGCREPLTIVEDGKTLGELAAPWAAHACAGAAQAENGGTRDV